MGKTTLKFRVWHEEKKQMEYSETYTRKEFPNENLAEFLDDWYGCELMQHTGLKDKNGTEIYEGDIVKGFLGTQSEVTFENGTFIWDFKPICYEDIADETGVCLTETWAEVVGNRYSNPKLLKEREQKV